MSHSEFLRNPRKKLITVESGVRTAFFWHYVLRHVFSGGLKLLGLPHSYVTRSVYVEFNLQRRPISRSGGNRLTASGGMEFLCVNLIGSILVSLG